MAAKIVKFISANRRLAILFAGLVILIAIPLFINSINQVKLRSYSELKKEEGKTYFSLTSEEDYLYKVSGKEGADAALEFIKKNPTFGKSGKLFPKDFSENVALKRSEKDMDDEYLKKNNISISNEHYFFEQKIRGIPVYSASVVVHLKNKNEVYSALGNISTGDKQTVQKITDEEAIQIALNEATKDEPSTEGFRVPSRKKYFVNKKVLGISEDPVDHIALEVVVQSIGTPMFFNTSYLVDLETGEILYKEEEVRDALNRSVYNCSTGSCSSARQEGAPATGDKEVDDAYAHFGDIYSYYFNTFGRDSYNNQGASLNAYVHIPSGMVLHGSSVSCPNAFWNGKEMGFCTGLVVLDVTAHELTHAVTTYTAGLKYQNQSGAINEGMSDIFGSALDNNWSMGEGSVLGIIRYMNNPPQKGSPDRLFSSLYYCGTQDKGGVHRNSGVLNKLFYLMTDGGSFNGCNVGGIGRGKSHPIAYQALTKYLTQTSNFKDVYISFMQSCEDLNGKGSSTCMEVEKALQATEVDQQPAGSQAGPTCSNIQRATPVCAGGSGTPPTANITPTPTNPSGITPTSNPQAITPTPTPPIATTPKVTQAPSSTSSLKVFTFVDNDGNGGYTSGTDTPYQGATIILSSCSTQTKTTDAAGNALFSSLPVSTCTFNVKLLTQPNAYGPYSYAMSSGTLLTVIFPIPRVLLTPPAPTATPTVTPTQAPSGGGTPSRPIPTTTYNCVEDTACKNSSGKKNLQLCPLICTPR